jgi:hypothetical protein
MAEKNPHRRAWVAFYRFYEQIVDRATDAIIDKEDSINSPYLGHGEEIAERYGHILGLTSNVLGALRSFTEGKAPPKPPPTKVASFTCPDAEVEQRLQRFFTDNPMATPVSVQVVPRAEACLCVVVYHDVRQGG